MSIGPYKENLVDYMDNFGFGALARKIGVTSFSVLGNFHVHPAGTKKPSTNDDISKELWKAKYKSTMFYILTNATNKLGYEKTPY